MLKLLTSECRRLRQAYSSWQDHDGPLMAAAVSYYVGLSLFPILLVLIAGIGMVLRYTNAGQETEQQVVSAISEHVSPAIKRHLLTALASVQDRSTVSGPIGLIGLLVASLAAFAQFQAAFDRIWNVPTRGSRGLWAGIRRTLIERGIAFLMLLGVGLLVMIVFVTGLVISHIEVYVDGFIPRADWIWKLTTPSATLLFNALIFTLVYRWLPKVSVDWRRALRGGVVAAIGWEFGRQVLAVYLTRTRYVSAYGVVGSFIAILLWCYYAVTVLFLGAEYIQQATPHADSHQRES